MRGTHFKLKRKNTQASSHCETPLELPRLAYRTCSDPTASPFGGGAGCTSFLVMTYGGSPPMTPRVCKAKRYKRDLSNSAGSAGSAPCHGVTAWTKPDASAELIQTIRLLSRSHRRFTEEQRVKVFRVLNIAAEVQATLVISKCAWCQ